MRERKPRRWPSLAAAPETRAAEALTRLEDITRLVSDLVWEADADFRLTFVSEHAYEALGFLPLQLEGKSFKELGQFIDEAGNPLTVDFMKPFRELTFLMTDAAGGIKAFMRNTYAFVNTAQSQWFGYVRDSRDGTPTCVEFKTTPFANNKNVFKYIADYKCPRGCKCEGVGRACPKRTTPVHGRFDQLITQLASDRVVPWYTGFQWIPYLPGGTYEPRFNTRVLEMQVRCCATANSAAVQNATPINN